MPSPTFTPNLNLTKLPPNYKVWAQLMNDNMTLLDAAISSFITFNNLQGAWANSTAYSIGDTVVDVDLAILYTCQVAHTSALIPTTFLEDRTANPTYWSVTAAAASNRGAWQSATAYNRNDFVLADGTKYAFCLVGHTSGANFSADLALGRWSVLIDLSVVGSLVLPVLSGASDALKFVITNSAGTSYEIVSGSTAMDRLGGILPVSKGGTGVTTSTGTGNTVLSVSPALTGTPTAPTPVTAAENTTIATTAHVHAVANLTGMPTSQRFTSGTAATYTTPAGVRWIKVRMSGGGGGGGGTTSGAAGGDTTFGTFTAGGGAGGGAVGGPTAGGTATGADINISGGGGAPGSGAAESSGGGGGSVLGSGGSAVAAGGNNGIAGGGHGGGGGGASQAGTSSAGGGGGAYCESIILNPAATYTYTVGAAGTAGTNAGAGTVGIIIVEEYY